MILYSLECADVSLRNYSLLHLILLLLCLLICMFLFMLLLTVQCITCCRLELWEVRCLRLRQSSAWLPSTTPTTCCCASFKCCTSSGSWQSSVWRGASLSAERYTLLTKLTATDELRGEGLVRVIGVVVCLSCCTTGPLVHYYWLGWLHIVLRYHSSSSSSSLFGMHYQCIAPLAANSLHSGISRASSIASSKVRLCWAMSFFRVAIQEV